MIKKVCILGLGYIGLPIAAMLADAGIEVLGVDIKQGVVDALNNGDILIEEHGLRDLIKSGVEKGLITAQTAPETADAFIIAVPTPIKKDKTANMDYVVAATESIVPFLKKGNTVVLESTSPPGTVRDLMLPIINKTGLVAGEDYYIAHSPERVIPGNIIHELIYDARVIGGINLESAEVVRDLYRNFVKGEIFLTDSTTAEMCKLMENTFRDVNIALANEMAKTAERLGINVWEAISYANKHPRVNYLSPGPGVGGHCIALDPWFIVEKSPETAKIVNLARDTNESMPEFVFKKAMSILNATKTKKAVMLGLTYKQDTDDTRESVTAKILDMLKAEGIEVTAYDPHVAEFRYLEQELKKAVSGASLLILGVPHTAFAELDYDMIKAEMSEANILDTRNFIDRQMVTGKGFKYSLLGDAKN